jgi:hypothetical protein
VFFAFPELQAILTKESFSLRPKERPKNKGKRVKCKNPVFGGLAIMVRIRTLDP